METRAYINWGRTVGDCPAPGCGDARELTPGQGEMVCALGHVSRVVWDDDTPAAMAALEERTEEKRRNWFPSDHPLALALGQPHGQTVDELRAEAIEGDRREGQAAEARAEHIVAVLAGLGVSATVTDDGHLTAEV